MLSSLKAKNEVEKLKTKRVITIGRHKDCDILLHSNTISKMHASIERSVKGGYLINDLNSMNGVFVNGRRIKGVANVTLNDKIYIGCISENDAHCFEGTKQLKDYLFSLETFFGISNLPIG